MQLKRRNRRAAAYWPSQNSVKNAGRRRRDRLAIAFPAHMAVAVAKRMDRVELGVNPGVRCGTSLFCFRVFRTAISENDVFLRASYKARLASCSMSMCATTRRAGIFRGWRGWSRIMWQPIRAYARNQRINQFLRVLCGLL